MEHQRSKNGGKGTSTHSEVQEKVSLLVNEKKSPDKQKKNPTDISFFYPISFKKFPSKLYLEV